VLRRAEGEKLTFFPKKMGWKKKGGGMWGGGLFHHVDVKGGKDLVQRLLEKEKTNLKEEGGMVLGKPEEGGKKGEFRGTRAHRGEKKKLLLYTLMRRKKREEEESLSRD